MAELDKYTSLGNSFGYFLPGSSPGNTYRYDYIKQRTENDFFTVLVEQNEITFKLVTGEFATSSDKATGFIDFLVIPLNTAYNSFSTIETQLLRAGKQLVFNSESNSKLKFRHILCSFIEDLYVNNYFRECGDTIALKAALEHVPLIQGIIYSFLFQYYYKKIRSEKDSTDLRKYYIEKFEEAYLNYSRFLSNPTNEKYFLPGGWFVRSKKQQKTSDIDKVLFATESAFINVDRYKKKHGFVFTEPLNIRNILKRYGVKDVLKLTLPAWLTTLLVFSMCLLIGFIILDVFEYNYNQAEELVEIHNSPFRQFVYLGLYISVIIFTVLSIVSAIYLSRKLRLKVVPGIFLPRMVIAIMSGWVVFLSGEELLKLDINLKSGLLLVIFFIIVFATLVFMVFEINNYAPSMNRSRVIRRSLVVCGLAFIVSYAFGFWVMTFVNKKFMSLDNGIVNGSEIKEIHDNRVDKINQYRTYLDSTHFGEKKYGYIHKTTIGEDLLDIITVSGQDTSEKQYREYFNAMVQHTDAFLWGTIKSIKLDKEDSLGYTKQQMDSILLERKMAAFYGNKQELMDKTDSVFLTHYKMIGKERMFEEYLFARRKIKVGGETIIARNYPLNPVVHSAGITITTFPNMLLARALIAMFIGIFFQLIIQDKTITEPI